MTRPRLLDLFCGAGGCAVGYHRAGFDVLGIDINPQPNYPFEFHKAGALEFLKCLREADEIGDRLGALNATGGLCLSDFAAIHASPPCQGYSQTKYVISTKGKQYPDLLGQTRRALGAVGLPWVIENVPGAPMSGGVLCGTMFGLKVRRHRLFETSFPLSVPTSGCHHGSDFGVYAGKVTRIGTRAASYVASSGRTHYRPQTASINDGREAMGIDWMDRHELSQAIPPAYTEFVGRQLIEQLVAK